MPIPLKQEIEKVTGEVRFEGSVPRGNESWVAWWYCGLYKNPKAESQPLVLVAYRSLANGILSDELTYRRAALTALGKIRLGTVWEQNRCTAKIAYKIEHFDVLFAKKSWRCTSFNEAYWGRAPVPYPSSIYPLGYEHDMNWLVEFDLANGGRLLVPCLEYYSRCYGRSQELKRVLATYPWEGASDSVVSRFYASIDEKEEPGKWKVKLRKRLVNDDVVFLAHAKYDPWRRGAALLAIDLAPAVPLCGRCRFRASAGANPETDEAWVAAVSRKTPNDVGCW